jgi:hypothetical protein
MTRRLHVNRYRQPEDQQFLLGQVLRTAGTLAIAFLAFILLFLGLFLIGG